MDLIFIDKYAVPLFVFERGVLVCMSTNQPLNGKRG